MNNNVKNNKENNVKKLNARVYGIVGLVSKFANWNADFDKYPKRSQGQIYASDKALKYAMRRYMEEKGENVFYKKTLNKNAKAMTYTDRYTHLFGNFNKQSHEDIIKNLLSCKDIKFFGTVATLGQGTNDTKNIGIRGIVQFTHGFNLNDDVQVIREVITSQFSSGNDKDQTTIGDMVLTDNAHYFYGFSLNENNIDNIREFFALEETKQNKNKKTKTLDSKESEKQPKLISVEEMDNGNANIQNLDELLYFTEDDYKIFKEACLRSVDAYNSASKAGCNNHFAVFIKTDKETYMPILIEYVRMEDSEIDDQKVKELNLQNLIKLIEKYKDNVIEVEIYYRPEYLKIREKDIKSIMKLNEAEKSTDKDFIKIEKF